MKKISKDIEGRMSNDVKYSDSDFDSTGQWTHFWHLQNNKIKLMWLCGACKH